MEVQVWASSDGPRALQKSEGLEMSKGPCTCIVFSCIYLDLLKLLSTFRPKHTRGRYMFSPFTLHPTLHPKLMYSYMVLLGMSLLPEDTLQTPREASRQL